MALTKLQQLALRAIQEETAKMRQHLFELSRKHPGMSTSTRGTDEHGVADGIDKIRELAEAIANPDK